MAINNGVSPSTHFGRQLKKERLAHGWTLREFSARTGIDFSQVSRIENGRQPPSEKVALACDLAWPERKGWFTEYWEETKAWAEIPATFRSWSDYEDKSTTLRSWTPGIINGLVQTEDYARALIATETGIDAREREARLRARMARQKRVLGRANPPRFALLADQAALYRLVGSPLIMATQLRYLLEVGARPNVVLQVMPEVAHASVASEYLIADDAVWSENVITGAVYVTPETLVATEMRFDTLRGECLKASESEMLIERQAQAWETTGASRPTQAVAEGRA
jgi:transcriptional regulator with XRE-family HTH domain